MKVSLIIPTYNREELLMHTVQDALNQDYVDLEIIVVDQTRQHQPETETFLRSVKDRIVYQQEAIPGLTRARNIAGRIATGDIFIFIDDDVTLPKDFVTQHTAAYHSGKYGASQGRVVESGKITQKPAWLYPHNRMKGGNNFPNWGETNVLTGCNMSVRKSVFMEIGGFDERFTKLALNEDTDFGFRCYRAGHKIAFNPQAWLKHYHSSVGGVDTGIEEKELSGTYYYCESLFAAKHFGPVIQFYFRLCLMWRGIKALVKLVNKADQEAHRALNE